MAIATNEMRDRAAKAALQIIRLEDDDNIGRDWSSDWDGDLTAALEAAYLQGALDENEKIARLLGKPFEWPGQRAKFAIDNRSVA
jgi:hypothetical protein